MGVNMTQEMAAEIEKYAKWMRLSTGKYGKVILSQWIDSGRKLKLRGTCKTSGFSVPVHSCWLIVVGGIPHSDRGLD